MHTEFKQFADKFGVDEHPTGSALVNAIRNNPPTKENAVSIFSYMASRQQDLNYNDWKVLLNSPFIPIDGTTSKWIEPSKVYFGSNQLSIYKDHFLYIGKFFLLFNYNICDSCISLDFGTQSNAFLRACGVKDEPSPFELAQEVVRSPSGFLDRLGFEKYLQLLRTIAANYPSLRKTHLFHEMKKSSFLIGVRTESHDSDKENIKFKLSSAPEIYLIDDPVMNQIFSPWG